MRGPRRALRVPAGDHSGAEEQRFKLLVDSVTDYAIFLLTPEGVVETWNHGARRLKGYDDHEIIGTHYSVFYPPESLTAGLPQTLLAEAHREGRAHHRGWRLRKDGSRFWADVVITALHHDDGTLAGFAKVTRDMTAMHEAQQARDAALAEQQAAVARLEELDRWRREFMAAVVHDLQTPVTAVTGFVRLLRDDLVPEEDRHDVLGRVLRTTGVLQELIHNLRSDSLLSEGAVELQPRPVSVRAFLDELLADLAPLLVEHRVTADLDDVAVLADPRALGRILRNLLGNAVRHTDPGTAVRVLAADRGDEVAITVEDDGEGIPATLLPTVFDRFERGQSGGTGLGLSIVRQYARLQQGRVAVDSEPGRGTRFTVTLPAARRAEGAAASPSGATTTPAPPHARADVVTGAVTAAAATTTLAEPATDAREIDPTVSDLVHDTTRRLLRLETVADAATLLEQFVVDLGGTVADAADVAQADVDHLPVDLSFGAGTPRLPVATDPAARLRLEFALPGLVEDARRAVDLLRATGRA